MSENDFKFRVVGHHGQSVFDRGYFAKRGDATMVRNMFQERYGYMGYIYEVQEYRPVTVEVRHEWVVVD